MQQQHVARLHYRAVETGAAQADLDREPPGGPGAPSAIYVLIRADKGTPWQHVQYVMQVCAQPNIAIYKMQFATTKRDDGKASTAADMDGE